MPSMLSLTLLNIELSLFCGMWGHHEKWRNVQYVTQILQIVTWHLVTKRGDIRILLYMFNNSYHLTHGCANHDTEGKRFKFPHPLLWRNEASLLDQRPTMYFPLALYACTVCCLRTEQCFSVLRTHKSDAVDGSSGRRYVTDQWHNVPLLRARGLGASKITHGYS